MSVFLLLHLISLSLSVSPPPPPPPPPPGLILSDLYHHLYFCSSVVKFLMVFLLTVCRYVSFYLSSPPSLSPSLPLLSSHSCLSLVWRASPFARGRKGLVSCLYATCTAVARSAAQSDRSTSPLILCGY